MQLRAAVACQSAEIETLLRRAFTPFNQRLGREIAADAYVWLGTAVARGDVLVGMDGVHVVGAVVTSQDAGTLTIEQIAVLPERQRAGIGSWLIGNLEIIAVSRGAAVIRLCTVLMMDDLLRFYGRLGFEETGRGPPDHGKDRHIRVFLQKALPGSRS